jgi:Xaa-Pro aminopeptidase
MARFDYATRFAYTHRDSEDPSRLLADLFRETGLSHGRIGVEDPMGFGDSSLLTGAVLGVPLSSAQGILDRLRMIKDADEIKILRPVCQIMDQGYQSAMEVIEEGSTEAEVGMDIVRAPKAGFTC